MFLKLRARMKELDVDQLYLAKKLKMCPASLSLRMTGKIQWQLDEMYAAMDILHLPHDQLHLYFPQNGKTAA